MTQSAMSHLIRKLEEEIGAKLFIRSGKTVRPTPAGTALYGHARDLLARYAAMEDDLNGLLKRLRGTLRASASMTAASFLLPQILYGFSRDYPDVAIELSVSNTDAIIRQITGGDIEVGICEGPVEDAGRSARLVFDEISEDEIVIISSEDNALAKKKGILPAQLLSQPFIMPEAGSGTREYIEKLFHSMKIDARDITVAMVLGSPDLIVQMVQAGTGISCVSKWSVFRAVKEGSINILDVAGRKMKRKIYLVSPRDEDLSAAARTFREFVRKHRLFVPF